MIECITKQRKATTTPTTRLSQVRHWRLQGRSMEWRVVAQKLEGLPLLSTRADELCVPVVRIAFAVQDSWRYRLALPTSMLVYHNADPTTSSTASTL